MTGKLGDRGSSDVIVRLKTGDRNRDNLFYTHSAIIASKCSYFATCLLPEDKPLLNSKFCIELVCSENEFDYHVMLLRLLYAVPDESLKEIWHNVRNAVGVLKLALRLGCDEIVSGCVQYLESVPWEENEEEEILKTLPAFGPKVLPVLARLQPVKPEAVREVFLSASRVATIGIMVENMPTNLKTLAQEQVEYMLTEDEDAPLIIADKHIRTEFRSYFGDMFKVFLTMVTVEEADHLDESKILEKVSALLWASRVLPKLELLSDMVFSWSGSSRDIICYLQNAKLGSCFWGTKLKVVEITCKVLEAVGYGSVVLPFQERTGLIKLWLPYMRKVKPQLEDEFEDDSIDSELWHNIECAMTSLILSLPSGDQAEILTEWLQEQRSNFPDLSEAFEVLHNAAGF